MLLLGSVSCTSEEVRQEPDEPEVALAKADELIEDDEYDEARQLLNEVKGNDITRKYAQIAQLKIAESYSKEDNLESAVIEYRRFIEQYPDSQYAPYAQYQIAMMYFSQIKGPERGAGQAKNALKEFRKLKTLYPRNPYKEIIEINIAKCLNVIAEYEFIVGRFYYKKDSYKAAIGRFQGILENYPDYKGIDDTLFYLSMSYRNSVDIANAKKYFEILKEKFPDSEYIEELKEELFEDE
jgi:outer membrane protein assembly factor BamD